MYFLNLTLGQFLVLFGSVSAVMVALYLFDRSRRKQVVSTLRFWLAAEQPTMVARRKWIQQPFSLILQLISMALLLLAIAQLRWGAQARQPRDHVLILDTSAWMGARTRGSGGAAGGRSLMDSAKQSARAYVRAVPPGDRLMLVRADALATPATAFEPNHTKIEQAIDVSEPGSTALNLEQALSFARRIQTQSGRRAGEIVFVGTGKIAEREGGSPYPAPGNLRVLPVPDPVENCGLRKVGVRRSNSDPDVWEIYASVHNYGSRPHTLTLWLGFGPSADGRGRSPVGSQRLSVAPGADSEATFAYRTRAAGFLEADLLPQDAFPDDDRAVLELPPLKTLNVAVYSAQPDLLRPVLSASPRVSAAYHSPSDYPAGGEAELVILDRFRPSVPPSVDSVWIDPPAYGSPIPVRARLQDVPFSHWLADHPLASGLRTKDFRLEATSVFEAAPSDVKIGEVDGGPVVVARPGKPKIVVFGFHPALSAMRYELATPLLFANILRWVAPETFRRWELSAASVGTVKTALESGVRPSGVRVLREDGTPVAFTVRDGSLHFFSGVPGTVRVLAGDDEYVYSLTLPQLWEANWSMPSEARRGLPRFAATDPGSLDLWEILAVLGGLGLLTEWFLYGRFSRGLGRITVGFSLLHRSPAKSRSASGARMARG
ncbi:MAG TPA: VWA domain-containing protein [Bryobacteraceae bacterium]|nr:VWA domain-containing protein [Bryobacteraceae bacterium]